MRTVWLLVALVAAVLTLAGTGGAAASADGTITGQVTNGTADVTAPDGLSVTLFTLQNDNIVSEQEALTGSSGRFQFQGLDTDQSLTYVAATTYAGVPYRSEPVQFAQGETQRAADVVVYETIEEPSNVLVESYTVVIEQGRPGVLAVWTHQLLRNTGDRTFVGVPSFRQGEQRRETLYFVLPRAASDIRLLSGLGESTSWVDFRGLVDTQPLRPGQREVVFHYLLPVVAPEVGFSIQSRYPIVSANLLAGDGLVTASPWLTTEGDISAEGKRFRRYSASAITPDGMVATQLEGIRVDNSARNLKWGLLAGVVALLLAALGVGAWWARRRAGARPDHVELERERARLVEEAARLDLQHEAGTLAEDQHARIRAGAKARLVELTRQLREGERS